MPNKTKILAFAGSTRKDSWNKKLVRAAAEALGGDDVEVTFIDLADYPLPLCDGDLQTGQGLPENARKLKQLFADHDGFLISSPEFNGSYSSVLKNTLDWVSVPDGKEKLIEPFRGKVAALISASPGQRGGLRGLDKLRSLLSDLQVIVLPDMCAVGSISSAFNEAGKLKDKKTEENIYQISKKLAVTAKSLSA